MLLRSSGDVNDACSSESCGPDADEHAGSECRGRELLRHETVDERGVNGQGDEEAHTLQRESTDDDGERFAGCELVGERCGVGRHDEQRIGWENPDGRHGCDGEGLRAPHHDVDSRRGGDSEECLRPEKNVGCGVDVRRSRFQDVLRNVELDEAERDDDGGNEEGLGRVQEGGFEGFGEEVKAQADHGGGDQEEDDVDDHEGVANGSQAVEAERH